MSRSATEMWIIVETRKQEFAVSANCVREIVALPDITAVPSLRPQDRGVINLRGRILPVIDMRKQFGWTSVPEEVQEFCKLMSQREEDHKNWLRTLEESVVSGIEFRLATDPKKCAFGLWHASYRSDSPWIANLLTRFAKPHNNVHALACAAHEFIAKGQAEKALQLIARERNGALREMCSLFQQLKELMRETVKEVAVIISIAQGTFALSVDRVVAVERGVPEVMKDVNADDRERAFHRILQRSSTEKPTLILDPVLFLPTPQAA